METLDHLVETAVADFHQVAALAGFGTSLADLDAKVFPKPHAPSPLPPNSMAVYAFFWRGQALKVGKVGVKSGPRFTYQHYNAGSAQSTLAASILGNQDKVEQRALNRASVAAWIKAETDRVNFVLSASHKLPILSLLEAFLHVRWDPIFEGRPTLAV